MRSQLRRTTVPLMTPPEAAEGAVVAGGRREADELHAHECARLLERRGQKRGLQRCGKSCRLRWINYLRSDLKRGAFSSQEEGIIVHLNSLLGNMFYINFYTHC